MSEKKKEFKFQYCFINTFDSESKQRTRFKLTEFISEFLKLPKATIILPINDYKAKIEKISQIENRYIHICMVKMEDIILPKKVYEDDRAASDIEIKDDEYLGTDVHMLYDTHNKVMMVQRTRSSLSINVISTYLNEFAHGFKMLNNNQVLEIDPISDEKILSSQSIVKKIDIRFGNIETVPTDKNNNIFQIMNTFNKFDAISGGITLSVGRTKGKLNSNEISDTVKIVKELKERYHNCITGAKATYIENDISFCYDLFDNVMNDIGYIYVAPRTSIKFEEIEAEMLRIYVNKLPALNNIIGYK